LKISHILAGTIKDIVTRYAHQTGHYVSRRFGWDCHGLPVEYEIDKTLKITDRDQVLKMGVANYNAECRGIVQRYTKEWEKTVTRLGRWIDFENDYKTMDPQFMEVNRENNIMSFFSDDSCSLFGGCLKQYSRKASFIEAIK